MRYYNYICITCIVLNPTAPDRCPRNYKKKPASYIPMEYSLQTFLVSKREP